MNQNEIEDAPYYGGRATKWPAIWGGIAIAFGVIGFFVQIFSVLQSYMMTRMPNGMFDEISASSPPTGDPAQDKIMEEMMKSQQEMMNSMVEHIPMSIGIAIGLAVIALVLAIGGILLCMRKRISSPILQTWAGLKIVGTFASIWISYTMTSAMMGSYGDMMNDISSSPGGGPSIDMGGIMSSFAMIGSVVWLIWGIWLPIFFFIHFNRDAVKEDMAQGPGWVKEPVE